MQWLRNRLGAKLLGYEQVWLRTCLVMKSPDFIICMVSRRMSVRTAYCERADCKTHAGS